MVVGDWCQMDEGQREVWKDRGQREVQKDRELVRRSSTIAWRYI